MNHHFIYPDIGTNFQPSVHHGLAHLSSVLKQNNHEVSLHQITSIRQYNEIIPIIKLEEPDMIGITVMSNQFEQVKEISRIIKSKYDIPIVCGGVHVTLNPEEVLNVNTIDYICIGEGEYPIINDSYNVMYPLIDNLDLLPFPDYSIFDIQKLMEARNWNFPIIASRGCPYQCYYCSNHALSTVQEGKYFRCRSVDNVIKQILQLECEYPIKSISFADDIFGINKEWVYEFCEKYKKLVNIPFECNLRVENTDIDLFKELKSANCVKVEMGIESGNEFLRKHMLNRSMPNSKIIEAFDNAHKVGIKTRAYNMIGLPRETKTMVRQTIELNKKVKPDQLAIFYFYPYKGTHLYDVCKEDGLITDKTSTNYVSESILYLPDITQKELRKLYNEFYRFMIHQELKSFSILIRYAITLFSYILRIITFNNEVRIIRYLYMKCFGIFQKLRG